MAMAEKCLRCMYSKLLPSSKLGNKELYSTNPENYYCDYNIMRMQMRPCKGGEDCTAYEERDINKIKRRALANFLMKSQ